MILVLKLWKLMKNHQKIMEILGNIQFQRAIFFCFSKSNCFLQCRGLEKQINELKEAVVLPLTHKDLFEEIGIQAPKGVILYGPPGTGKTLMARACAGQTKSTFLKLAGPQLVQVLFLCFPFIFPLVDNIILYFSRCLLETVPN